MSVGFGFSVGDFLAAIKLVGTVVDALREASHSTTKFHELLKELESLEIALESVRKIEFDDSQRFQKIALYQTAAQCQRSIDALWTKVKKYQPHLASGGTESGIKDDWAKIKWAVCRRTDMEEFRAEVRGHICSIQVLLEAINAETQRKQYASLAGRIQTLSFQVMSRLQIISDAVIQNVAQSTSLMQICETVLHTDLRVFQMVHDIHLFITRIPGQVQRQQPVYFIDPFNRETPFHLEFIRSAEALRAVLAVNFKALDCDPTVIDRGDFVIEELGSRRTIDLAEKWELIFYPNQRVAMSIVLREKEFGKTKNHCPRCQNPYTGSADEEIYCSSCGTIYRRIEESSNLQQEPNDPNHGGELIDGAALNREASHGSLSQQVISAERGTSLSKFRRLRILAQENSLEDTSPDSTRVPRPAKAESASNSGDNTPSWPLSPRLKSPRISDARLRSQGDSLHAQQPISDTKDSPANNFLNKGKKSTRKAIVEDYRWDDSPPRKSSWGDGSSKYGYGEAGLRFPAQPRDAG